jgi:seryl-tRNA synthetase
MNFWKIFELIIKYIMLDIKIIRNNPEGVRYSIEKKWIVVDLDRFLELDKEIIGWRQKLDELRALKNKVSKEIPRLKDDEKQKALKEMKEVSGKIKDLEPGFDVLESEFKELHSQIPNLLSREVPVWKDENENVVIKEVWKIKEYDFKPKDHHELWEDLDLIDKKKAAEVTGARFYYLKWDLVLLEQAIINFTFSVLIDESILSKIIKENKLQVSSKPFVPIIPPYMVSYSTAEKMGRLYPMDDRYCHDEDKQMLIGSAEHSLGPIHMNEVLKEEELPKRYFASTPAFRREAGTYGKDTRGIFRVHQFDKIEIESFTTPSDGLEEQKFIVAIQEYLVKSLELPYRLVDICTWDIGKPDFRQFDIETYFPGQWAYRETHTSDYMSDFQAYSLNTKVERKDGSKELVHMNDATAFALGRIMAAIMENNQTKDGKITIPEVLRKFMWGREEI